MNFKNTTRFILASDRDRLGLSTDDYLVRGDPFVEPEPIRPNVGNLSGTVEPVFQDASTGNFRLKQESPLIDAGNNQSYIDAMNIYLFDGQKDILGNVRMIGNAIDIGAFEYDPSDTGNTHLAEISDGITVWSQQGKLYVRSEQPVRIGIYTISGILIGRMDLKENETIIIQLDRGVYIVVPESGGSRKALVW